jgi:hypothetical protein
MARTGRSAELRRHPRPARASAAAQRNQAFIELDRVPGWTRDAFFWWMHSIHPGQMLSVHMSQGWGPHTQRSDVLWIGSEHDLAGTGIGGAVPAADVRRWARHHARASRP